MAQGLQVWDASGNLIADVTEYFGKVLGVASISAGVNGSVTNAGFAIGTPFWFLTALTSFPAEVPNITRSGNTLSWSFVAGQPAYDCRLVYGVW